MTQLMRADTIEAYSRWAGVETLNPLVGIIDFAKVEPMRHARKLYGIYAIFLKDAQCGQLRYGCQNYDYQDGPMLFVAPGHAFGSEDDGTVFQPDGLVLIFHPDLLQGTPLARAIKDYTFFNYEVNEALHLSKEERTLIQGCFQSIAYELRHAIDRHSRQLIVDAIKMLLDYATRFYDRQFITRENQNHDILARLETVLTDYFASSRPQREGLPTVQQLADEVHLSPNYLSDLMRKETGITALNYIHQHLIDRAKTRLASTSLTVSEIAYQLGFQYSQHFTRLFKNKTGMTPNEYRLQVG